MSLREHAITGVVASGGIGTIFKAYRLEPDTRPVPVAIKMLQSAHAGNRALRRDLEHEAEIGLRLHHPNIVRTEALLRWGDRQTGGLAAVLEFVDGPTVSEVIRRARSEARPLRTATAAILVLSVAEALAYLWDAPNPEGEPLRLIHRDLKPANLMLTSTGVLRVMDFGIATDSWRTRATAPLTFKGTLRYASPEQAMGHRQPTPASDVYALGAIGFELLTQRPLFPQQSVPELLAAIAASDARPQLHQLRGPAAALRPVLERMLQRNPLDRFQDAAHLAFELHRLIPRLEGAGEADADLAGWARALGAPKAEQRGLELERFVDVPGVIRRATPEELEMLEGLEAGAEPHSADRSGHAGQAGPHPGIAAPCEPTASCASIISWGVHAPLPPTESGPVPGPLTRGRRSPRSLGALGAAIAAGAMVFVPEVSSLRSPAPVAVSRVVVADPTPSRLAGGDPTPSRLSAGNPTPNPLPVGNPTPNPLPGGNPTPNPLPGGNPTPNPLPVAGRGLRKAVSALPASETVAKGLGMQDPIRGQAVAENSEQLNKSRIDGQDAPPRKGEGSGEGSLREGSGEGSLREGSGEGSGERSLREGSGEGSLPRDNDTNPVHFGEVTITSIPRARIWINGHPVSDGTISNARMREGAYRVRMVTGDGFEKRFDIDVQGGQTHRYIWSFELQRFISPTGAFREAI